MREAIELLGNEAIVYLREGRCPPLASRSTCAPRAMGTRLTMTENLENRLLNLVAGPVGHSVLRLRNREAVRRLKALAEGISRGRAARCRTAETPCMLGRVRWGLIAVIAVLVGASAAHAAKLPDALTIPDNLDCRQTFASYGPTGIPSWTVGDRGQLVLHVDSNTFKPTSYDFDAFWLTRQARAGGWSWSGRVNFQSGPLALQREGWPTVAGYWYDRPRAMPHDNVRGRTRQSPAGVAEQAVR